MRAEQAWEGRGLTYANVMWDEAEGLFKMWFAGGEIREADAIGYATSGMAFIGLVLGRILFSVTGTDVILRFTRLQTLA
jgi:hypothetical protein